MRILSLLCSAAVLLSRSINIHAQTQVDPATLREQGDRALQSGMTEAAIKAYTNLIVIEPSVQINYFKRSSAYLFGEFAERNSYNLTIYLVNKFDLSLSDADKVLELDPMFQKGYLHRGKLLKRLGNCNSAVEDFKKLQTLDSKKQNKDVGNLIQESEKCVQLTHMVDKLFNDRNWEELKPVLLELTSIATSSRKYLEMEIDLFRENKEHELVIATAGKLLLFDKNNMHAYLNRGDAYFFSGNDEMAMKYVYNFSDDFINIRYFCRHYKEGLRFNPEHRGLKAAFRKIKQYLKLEEIIQDNMNHRRYVEAVNNLNQALEIDPSYDLRNKNFHMKKCQALKTVRFCLKTHL